MGAVRYAGPDELRAPAVIRLLEFVQSFLGAHRANHGGERVALEPASVGFAEMRLSANADCSGPYQLAFARATPTRVDLSTNPEIARTAGLTRGTYPCVALRISDLLRYQPVVTDGPCIAGVTTVKDVYRVGNEATAWRDIDGGAITARGTDALPVEDLVWIFVTTNEAAVDARGFGVNQTITLDAPLVIPGTSTFYWDLTDALGDEGDGLCGTVAGRIGFR